MRKPLLKRGSAVLKKAHICRLFMSVSCSDATAQKTCIANPTGGSSYQKETPNEERVQHSTLSFCDVPTDSERSFARNNEPRWTKILNRLQRLLVTSVQKCLVRFKLDPSTQKTPRKSSWWQCRVLGLSAPPEYHIKAARNVSFKTVDLHCKTSFPDPDLPNNFSHCSSSHYCLQQNWQTVLPDTVVERKRASVHHLLLQAPRSWDLLRCNGNLEQQAKQLHFGLQHR